MFRLRSLLKAGSLEQSGPLLRLRLSSCIPLLSVIISQVPVTGAGAGTEPHIVLHARLARLGETCAPSLAGCEEIDTSAFLEPQVGFYFVYVMAVGGAPESGVQEVNVGLAYDYWSTLSGADIFRWTSCADGESPSPGWYQEGGSNRIYWNAENCRTGEFAVAGYFYVTAYSADQMALVPVDNGPATVTMCGGDPEPLAETSLGIVGFGGINGCNPCVRDCMYTPAETLTWGRIKALHQPGE
jgi:hypothetical protein